MNGRLIALETMQSSTTGSHKTSIVLQYLLILRLSSLHITSIITSIIIQSSSPVIKGSNRLFEIFCTYNQVLESKAFNLQLLTSYHRLAINFALNPCALFRFFEELSPYFVELQNRPRIHVLKANKLELARCHFNLVGLARGNSSTSRLPVLRP